MYFVFFFCKQKTVYEMRISDWSSDVCSSDLQEDRIEAVTLLDPAAKIYLYASRDSDVPAFSQMERARAVLADYDDFTARSRALQLQFNAALFLGSLLRSEEHTSELQSLMRISYAVFCLKKKKIHSSTNNYV